MKKIKNILFSKPFCIIMLICAFIYGLILPFCWGNDPTTETGTLSLLCGTHKPYFWLWVIFTGGGLICNTQYMYNKFAYKSKLLDALCALSAVSIICIALTLGHSADSWEPKRIVHWIATGLFIVFIVAAIALFFILERKNHKSFKWLTVCTFLILSTFLVMFAAMGKSALMEMVPLALIEIFLFVINFTPLIKD